MSTPVSLITPIPAPRITVRARHGAAGVVAQYIQDLTHPLPAVRVAVAPASEVLLSA